MSRPLGSPSCTRPRTGSPPAECNSALPGTTDDYSVPPARSGRPLGAPSCTRHRTRTTPAEYNSAIPGTAVVRLGSRHRAGLTLMECLVYISLLGIVGEMSIDLMARIRPEPAGLGASVDLACERLRRDLRDGATTSGDILLAGAARWQVVEGRLRRDDVAGAAVKSVTWQHQDHRWVVTVTPLRGATRTIAVTAPTVTP